MEILFNTLLNIRDSKEPAQRLLYSKCLKALLGMGKRLKNINPFNEELDETIEGYKKLIEDYELYPALPRKDRKNHEFFNTNL
jgi:hypothetical protein